MFHYLSGANKVSALNPSSSLQNRELRDVEKFKNFIPDGIVKSDVASEDYDKEEMEYGGMSHSKEENRDRRDSREGSSSSDVEAVDVINNVTNVNNISNKKNNVFDKNNIGSENINNDNTNYNNDFTNNNISSFSDNDRSNSNSSTMVNNNNLINNNNTQHYNNNINNINNNINNNNNINHNINNNAATTLAANTSTTPKVGELEISSTTTATTTSTTIPPSLSSATTASAALETSSLTLLSTTASTEATTSTTTSTTTTTSMPWSVSAGNTTILRHPNNNITLYASISVHGVNVSADDYKFQWMMVSSSPPNQQSGQMIDMSTSSLKLITLQVGNYTFKVTAMKEQDAREALVHVVVLPR
ncbi:hypothetical protein HELRODRAFT_181994 [Helobdella robusta]|uniref:Uncharacterized protein n=1 Tax=Helobdella robusta TaxID=6412 RepID=T1FHK9_HELRO|nr:hypothetical protein HELRODRAFT_181994 [Helobdella robusta]ESN91935.1 hypothetical protein HELRODRAFT_181994 [Helobdella robusta]